MEPFESPVVASVNEKPVDMTVEDSSASQPTGVLEQQQAVEHPAGDEIRRQVEYYFSDENLPTDAYLLDKTGGKENLPVAIKSICSFPRMRRYKPYTSVVESLKKSTFLEVVDKKYIKRKVALTIDPTVTLQEIEDVKKEKGKKSNKPPANQPWMTKGMMKPTGFEEYFADAPVTPAIYVEEQSLYDSNISFETRIETAIQRYRARRKFHQETAKVFNNFMNYGGIECGPKMFGGSGPKDLEEMDAAEIAAMTAIHFVSQDVLCSDNWEVDFAGVARGYFSCHIKPTLDSSTAQIDIPKATNVVRNFYNHLLHHNVCPEFEDQIVSARNICDATDLELFNVMVASERLPGPFNSAVSAAHDGALAGVYVDEQSWHDDETPQRTLQDCREIIKFAIHAYGSSEQYARASEVGEFATIYEEQIGLEVTKVEMADDETRALYSKARQQRPYLSALGKLHCRRWTYPCAPRFEHSEEALRRQQVGESIVLWVEEETLQYCFVGMKIEGEVRELDVGIKWLDRVRAISPSFFEWLPNETYRLQKVMKSEEEAQQRNNQVNGQASAETNQVDEQAFAETDQVDDQVSVEAEAEAEADLIDTIQTKA